MQNGRAHNFYQLSEQIVARSVACTWDDARLEWEVDEVFDVDPGNPGTCLCGHHPIIEHCVLVNRRNGNHTVVGNVCVKKFLSLSADTMFEAFKRIRRDCSRSLNAKAIEYARRKGWVNDWERRFLLDTMRKRKLSERQRAKRLQINERLVERWRQRRIRGANGEG